MSRYTGNHCPVCEQVFCDTDDIVVCPECGTPHHRACWQHLGTCAHQAEHAAGFEWKPESDPEAASVKCPNCGADNPHNTVRCTHCGVPLTGDHEPRTAEGEVPIYARRTVQDDTEPVSVGADGVMRFELGPDDPIDGIRARDWASYVGRSSLYYLMHFFRMSKTRQKIGLCFSAFFFGPAYLFYRKMWKQGLLTAVLWLLLQVPFLLTILTYFNAPLLGAMPTGWLPTAMVICNFASAFLNFALGLFSVSWYKKEAEANIRAICEEFPEGDARADALALRGGTSMPAAILYYAALTLLGTLFCNLAGPAFMQYALHWLGW